MNVDISCAARHRNSVCGQGLQHIPKEIKFKIDCVTLKNRPRIGMISFKQNIAASPPENRPGFRKAKAKSANVAFPCNWKLKKQNCSLLLSDRRNATTSKLWAKGFKQILQNGNKPCARALHKTWCNGNTVVEVSLKQAREMFTQKWALHFNYCASLSLCGHGFYYFLEWMKAFLQGKLENYIGKKNQIGYLSWTKSARRTWGRRPS